jgi:hypothetical protein
MTPKELEDLIDRKITRAFIFICLGAIISKIIVMFLSL